jgi:hypothetical protein
MVNIYCLGGLGDWLPVIIPGTPTSFGCLQRGQEWYKQEKSKSAHNICFLAGFQSLDPVTREYVEEKVRHRGRCAHLRELTHILLKDNSQRRKALLSRQFPVFIM